MSRWESYDPGPARGAQVEKNGDAWTLMVVRELRHAPEKVWQALTDPAHLREWSPFDADRSLATSGAVVKLTTVGTPQAAETTVKQAEENRLLEYAWGDQNLRWQLEPMAGGGTRLTLWHNINKNFISMGAAGWHICLDVMSRFLEGHPIGRLVAGDALQFGGWQRLNGEYASQFGIEAPTWPARA